MAQTVSPASVSNSETSEVLASQAKQHSIPTVADILRKSQEILWSPFAGIVLLAAIIAVIIGYQFGPSVEIKLGSGYDAPFLNLKEQHGFGGEVRPVASATSTDITDNTAASGPISQTNTADWRADLPNAWQPTSTRTHQPLPEPVAENYRWALQRPIVLLPGTGAFPAQLSLKLAGSPVYKGQHIEMLLNGVSTYAFDIKPGAPVVKSFAVAADKFSGGSLAVELRVTNQGAPLPDLEIPAEANSAKYKVPEGFKLYDLKLQAQGGGFTFPAISTLVFLTLTALFFYFIFAYPGLARLPALLLTGGLLIVAAFLLATYRLELTDFVTRLALLTFVTALALPLLELSLPRLAARWNMTIPKSSWTILLVIFVVGLLLRGGGVLYPQTVVVDSPAHLFEINKILNGQFVQEYLNKDLSKVPGQWQSASLIPYPTIPYFVLAPFGVIGDPAIGINLFNTLLDALRIFVIFGLALKLGTGVRAATVAAAIYLFVPSTWLLNSWGNWPTTLSLWLATLYLLLLLVYLPKLNKRGVWLGLTLLLTFTMINYTVTAVFVGMLLLIFAAGLFFQRGDTLAKRNGKLIFFSTVAASVLAVALYYWQFVGDILFNTLPSFGQELGQGQSLGFGSRSLSFYYGLYTDHIFNFYGVGTTLTLALTVYGFLLFAPRLSSGISSDNIEPDFNTLRSRTNLWFMASWFVVFVFFGFVGWKVDMVDKQVWFIVPLAIVLASLGVVFLWQKLHVPILQYAGRILVIGCTLWLTYSSVTLWVYRLAFKRH